jgi:hypothetical protein
VHKCSTKDFEAFFLQFNLFSAEDPRVSEESTPKKMNFDTFKKTFFSHLHHTFNMTELMQELHMAA